jgi:site-specific DNA recombinase
LVHESKVRDVAQNPKTHPGGRDRRGRGRGQHLGHPITGEQKTKKTKSGERLYSYYRCTYCNKPGHPQTRVTEADLDRQVLAVFDKMRVEDEGVRDWFRTVLASQTRDAQVDSRAQRAELTRQETMIVAQQDRLLNLRLAEDIDQETFARRHPERPARLDQAAIRRAGPLPR